MIILFLIDKLPFRAIKGNNLLLAARNLLPVVVMCCWKVKPWSKTTLMYLHWFDYGKSVWLSAVLYLSLLSYLRREKRMDLDFLTLLETVHLASQVDRSL